MGAWMFVCCECCVLSGRGFCDQLITHPEEPYRLLCVVECDLDTTRMRRPWPALGRSATAKKVTMFGWWNLMQGIRHCNGWNLFVLWKVTMMRP